MKIITTITLQSLILLGLLVTSSLNTFAQTSSQDEAESQKTSETLDSAVDTDNNSDNMSDDDPTVEFTMPTASPDNSEPSVDSDVQAANQDIAEQLVGAWTQKYSSSGNPITYIFNGEKKEVYETVQSIFNEVFVTTFQYEISSDPYGGHKITWITSGGDRFTGNIQIFKEQGLLCIIPVTNSQLVCNGEGALQFGNHNPNIVNYPDGALPLN